jgi:hypothetical protein
MEQPVSSGHHTSCETEPRETCRSHKYVLCQIDTHDRNLVHDFPFRLDRRLHHLDLGTTVPCQGGKVPYTPELHAGSKFGHLNPLTDRFHLARIPRMSTVPVPVGAARPVRSRAAGRTRPCAAGRTSLPALRCTPITRLNKRENCDWLVKPQDSAISMILRD